MNREIWDQIKTSINKKNSNKPVVMGLLDSMVPQKAKESALGVLELEFCVKSDYHKEKIEGVIMNQLTQELKLVYKKPFDLKVKVDKHDPVASVDVKQMSLSQLASAKPSSFRVGYTFDSFVVGSNNEFAHAASYRVAQHPGQPSSNPLFIFGATGLGKTHLLHSIGNYLEETSSKRVKYISAERFLNECVDGIRHHSMSKFRTKYRQGCDVLLMDDIHVLGRGEHAQEEFFHTLNSFFDTGRQVVVACDRLPKEISGLKDRIRTRLEGGLIVDIKMPDIETKIAILNYKSETLKFKLSSEVSRYIASISKRSIRELEGNLNKVMAFSQFRRNPVTIDFVKKILLIHEEKNTVTVDDIQKLVSSEFAITKSELKSKSRQKNILAARQLAMYLVQKHTKKTLKEVGSCFGNRDHTTVLNSIRKINSKLKDDSNFKSLFNKIETDINNIVCT